MIALDSAAVVVLVGASGSGKSTWAGGRFRRSEIVSSDDLRSIVGSGAHDLDATADAFRALELIVAARVRRGLTTVIDTLGTDVVRRRAWLELARSAALRSVVVVFDTDPAECRRRNRLRERPVPAAALSAQLRRKAEAADEIASEGWDEVVRVESGAPPRPVVVAQPVATPSDRELRFVLQVSRFPSNGDLSRWLVSVALAAGSVGFDGLALMDHLIQIPQVGRAWEPIPEPWVTLGLLAGLPTELRLGTLVSPVSLHSPGRLAKMAATLDVLTGGRAFCGVGAGWWEREHLGFGMAFPPAAQRVDDLERALGVMRALWAPGTKPGAGLPETGSYPRPVGDLPIIVGGRGARVLSIARRLGDACNVASDLASVERAVRIMAGKRVTVLDTPVLGRDREHAAQLVERLRGRASAVAYARLHHAGTAAEHLARYRTLADHGVDTVFVALPELALPELALPELALPELALPALAPPHVVGADEVERWAPVIAAFA